MQQLLGYGEDLIRFRQERGWNQAQLAEVLSKELDIPRLNRSQVSQYEAESITISYERLRKLESLLEVPEGTYILRKFFFETLGKDGIEIPKIRHILRKYLNVKNPQRV